MRTGHQVRTLEKIYENGRKDELFHNKSNKVNVVENKKKKGRAI